MATYSDDELSSSESEPQEEVKTLRKSSRIRNAKAPKVRRSSRLNKRTSKSRKFKSLRTSFKAIRDMKNKRRLGNKSSNRGKILSQAHKSRSLPLRRNFLNITQENGEDKDQDSDCDADPGLHAKTSRASSLYREFHRCHPRYLDRLHSGAELADINPLAVDRTVGFESIGGLSCHIAALQEMVVFPLRYPEVFDSLKIQPPRGCLFHGPPGTGKTLVARALANECCHGSRKVSFFMRKGSDCLTKWVGESERQLRLLFEKAKHMQPSIIFFDEIDGLAPVRSSRQDQIHSSIVTTLLSLMDGLNSRGQVIVIGATNRLDAIDPALRRPGRFDREFLFGLPDQESRKDILKIHTRQWSPPPSADVLEELAQLCDGYSGADLRGLCTEAALCALRRRYPQIYGTSLRLQLDPSSIVMTTADFQNAMTRISPTSQRSNATAATPLTATVAPLLSAAVQGALERLRRRFPLAQKTKRKRETELTSGFHDNAVMDSSAEETSNATNFTRTKVRLPTVFRPRLLLVGRPGSGQSSHVAPALLHALDLPLHSLEIFVLHGASSVMPEEACVQTFLEAKRSAPSVLYLPHLQQWWETAGGALRTSFLSLLSGIPYSSPVLLLATCDVRHDELDPEIRSLFSEECGEVFSLTAPSEAERRDFFQDVILRQPNEAPPPAPESQPVEVLPLAPPLPPPQLSERKRRRLEEQEEDLLCELRLFLRGVIERLTLDRRFKVFSKPVDAKKIVDYRKVVRRPMDLSTLLTNIDKHRYITVSEFVSDATLIWQNALEYNPPESGAIERNIRHRAFLLEDTLHAIIREDLDRDFERECQAVKRRRMERAATLDYDPEKSLRRSKRVRKTAEKQQKQYVQDLNAARASGNISEPPQVDHGQLEELLQCLVSKTEGAEVEGLLRLHAHLSDCIDRHRGNTDLVKELQAEVEAFSSGH